MGVNGLWKILNKSSKNIDLSSLQNSILAIDTSIWLVRFIKSTSGRQIDRRAFLKLIWMRICTLIFYGIRPVFVFDGRVPEIKKKTTAKRKKLLKNSATKYQQKLEKVLLSQFGLTSIEQLKKMLNDKENIRNLKFITEHNDDQFHLKCDEIELDESDEDQIEKEEEIAYTVDSDEFFALDDEAKLNSLHIAKRHQKRISKEIIAEVSCDYSPDQYSQIQMQNFIRSSNLSKRIDETIQNVNQTRMKQSSASPTTKYMLQRIEKDETDNIKEETITMVRRRDIFNLSSDNLNTSDDNSFIIDESFEDQNTNNRNDSILSDTNGNNTSNDTLNSTINHEIEESYKNEVKIYKKETLEVNQEEDFSDIEFEEEVFSCSSDMHIQENINVTDNIYFSDNKINTNINDNTTEFINNDYKELVDENVINVESDDEIEVKKDINTNDLKSTFNEEYFEYDENLIERIEQIEKGLLSNISNSEPELQSLARQSAEVDDEFIEDFKRVLKLFGIPYIESFGEADAQCAYLNMIGAVDGIISDDSDIFLFGGRTLIKNAFSKKSSPSLFWMESIEYNCGFSRYDLIFLALLLGSDYTDGIKGIGTLSATDIVSHFKGKDGPKNFIDWINGEYEISDKNFEKKYSKYKSKPELFKGWPNKLVIDSYLHPPIKDDVIEWKEFDLNGLKELGEFIGWSNEHIDTQLKPIINKYESLRNTRDNRELELDKIKLRLNETISSFSTPKRRKKNTNALLVSKKMKTV